MAETETLKLQHVILKGTQAGLAVDVLYANAREQDQATEYVTIHLPLRSLEYPRLVEARLAVLERMRDLAETEIRAIRAAERRTPPLKL